MTDTKCECVGCDCTAEVNCGCVSTGVCTCDGHTETN